MVYLVYFEIRDENNHSISRQDIGIAHSGYGLQIIISDWLKEHINFRVNSAYVDYIDNLHHNDDPVGSLFPYRIIQLTNTAEDSNEPIAHAHQLVIQGIKEL